MIELNIGQKPVTFSPDLYAHDECANYWIRQVTIRLRREICWIWHERGLHSYSQTSTLPPFEDKIPAILDMSRFREEKQKFFKVDPTARYLTGQLESDTLEAHKILGRGLRALQELSGVHSNGLQTGWGWMMCLALSWHSGCQYHLIMPWEVW